MNKERMTYIAVLFSVFAACFAVYHFYFKAKLEKYAADKQLLENLNDRYANLNTTFKDEDPDTVISRYKSVVESWNDAIDVRVPYFNDTDWREHEKPPEDVFILQFWYGDLTRKMTYALWEKAQAKYGAQVYQLFPLDVQSMLGVAYAEQWQGYDITRELVTDQLERLSYGISAIQLLMDHNAQQIRQVSIYDPTPSGFIGANVEYQRMGLSFIMEMKDLVKFVDDLRGDDHYFSIQGMKVAHQYIGVKYEPKMEVEMYLLRTRPKVELTAAAIGASGNLQPANAQQAFSGAFRNPFQASEDDGDAQRRVPQPTGIAKFWKWFKRTVLFTN